MGTGCESDAGELDLEVVVVNLSNRRFKSKVLSRELGGDFLYVGTIT